MTLQKPRPGESFATKFTLVVEVVGEDVHGEGGHADVHLAADVTLLRICRVKAAVGLPVSGEVTACSIMFPTICTCVLGLFNLIESLFTPAVCDWELAVGVTGVVAVVVVCCVIVEEGLDLRGRVGKAGSRGRSRGEGVTRVRDGRGQRHMVTNLGPCNRGCCHNTS